MVREHPILNLKFIIVLTLVLLAIGVLDFYIYNEENWITSFYEAASILSAVGASDTPITPEGKIFAGIYTLVAGLGYIIILSYIVSSYLERSELEGKINK